GWSCSRVPAAGAVTNGSRGRETRPAMSRGPRSARRANPRDGISRSASSNHEFRYLLFFFDGFPDGRYKESGVGGGIRTRACVVPWKEARTLRGFPVQCLRPLSHPDSSVPAALCPGALVSSGRAPRRLTVRRHPHRSQASKRRFVVIVTFLVSLKQRGLRR